MLADKPEEQMRNKMEERTKAQYSESFDITKENIKAIINYILETVMRERVIPELVT